MLFITDLKSLKSIPEKWRPSHWSRSLQKKKVSKLNLESTWLQNVYYKNIKNYGFESYRSDFHLIFFIKMNYSCIKFDHWNIKYKRVDKKNKVGLFVKGILHTCTYYILRKCKVHAWYRRICEKRESVNNLK